MDGPSFENLCDPCGGAGTLEGHLEQIDEEENEAGRDGLR